MKLVNQLLLAACFMVATPCSYGQLTKEQIKEHQELSKMTTEQANKKASKDARNEAKRLKKEGWKAAPGSLPMEKQLDRSFAMFYELDTDYQQKYFTEQSMAVGTTFNAAKMQASELARLGLIGQIQSEATAIVDNSVANNQLTAAEAESITKSIMSGKTLSSQSLGRIIPVVELYRDLPNGNKEVMIRIFYDGASAREIARKAALGDLKDEAGQMK